MDGRYAMPSRDGPTAPQAGRSAQPLILGHRAPSFGKRGLPGGHVFTPVVSGKRPVMSGAATRRRGGAASGALFRRNYLAPARGRGGGDGESPLNVFGYLYLEALREKYTDSGTRACWTSLRRLQSTHDNIAISAAILARTVFGQCRRRRELTRLLGMLRRKA